MSNKKNDDLSHFDFVPFIDILFAVVLGQSFIILSSILQDPWKTQLRLPVVFAVYALVMTSWYGYHQSVKVVRVLSTWRWLIDVMLLFVYYAGFVAAEGIDSTKIFATFNPVLLVFMTTFILYSLWDGIRLLEYRSKPEMTQFRLKRRFATTLGFAIVFVALWLSYILLPGTGTEWGYFVGIIVLLIAFRILKIYKEPKSAGSYR